MSFIGIATAITVSALTTVPVVVAAVKALSDKDKSEVVAYHEEDVAYYEWLKRQNHQIELEKKCIEPLSVEGQQVKTTNTTSNTTTVNGGTNITINGGTNNIVINNITK